VNGASRSVAHSVVPSARLLRCARRLILVLPLIGEIIVPFSRPRRLVKIATEVRSTLLLSSIAAIRRRGRFEEYADHLDTRYRDTLLLGVAGVWLPMAVGFAHYEACDRLGFSAADIIENGKGTGSRIEGTFLAGMLRAAKLAGVTPWTPIEKGPTLHARTFVGGDMQIVKVGPKEAVIETIGVPLQRVPYYHPGLRGVWLWGLSLFCTKVYVTELPSRSEMDITLRFQWV
jgi:hypothetical protein